MLLADNVSHAQTLHRVGKWHVSIHAGLGSLGRTGKARGALL